MRQIKAVLEVRYDIMPDLFTYKKRVLQALGLGTADNVASIVENVNIQVKNQFAHVTVEPYRLMITVERCESKKAQEFIIGVYEKLNNLLHLSSVKQVGYRCMFISESDDKFSDLVNVYKNRFFKDTSLVTQSVDVAIPLTFKVDDFRVNFASGPMEPKEIKERLEYKDIDVKNSYYVDLDFIKYNLAISAKQMKQHIEDVRNHQKKFIGDWEAAIYE